MSDLEIENFIQKNSPNSGFLQSEEWRKFQEAVGKKTFNISDDEFWANIVEHQLPIVGKYFYIPRWPSARISNFKFQISNQISNPNNQTNKNISDLIGLARKNNAGWIRVEPENNEALDIIINSIEINGKKLRVVKAPHDMQPKEIFAVDITKSEEELLAGMKQKTRYNIKLSQKHGVSVKVISNDEFLISNQTPKTNNRISKNYFDKFIELVKITAKRDGIMPHPESYYRKMFEIIPSENLKLYVAEYAGKIIAANIIIHYGNTATYLHGASDNEYRNVMAPYLLQWQAILDAKKAGLTEYDFGGVKTNGNSSWAGITKFKTGFSQNTKPAEFLGSYDIILDNLRYSAYRFIQALKIFI